MDYTTWKRRQLAVTKVAKHPLGVGWKRSHLLSEVVLHTMDAMGVQELKDAGYGVDTTLDTWRLSLHAKPLAAGRRGDYLGCNRGDYFAIGQAMVHRDTIGGGSALGSVGSGLGAPAPGGPKV